jgi:hypothetical protein
MEALRASSDPQVELTSAASHLGDLAAGLNAYPEMAPETKALMIDTYFSIWERLPDRFAYGYPLGVMRIAILSGHRLALADAIKAALYIETSAIQSVSSELETARQRVALAERQAALTIAVAGYHAAADVMDPETLSKLLAGKIIVIATSLFEAPEVVPTLAELLTEMQDRFPEDAVTRSDWPYPLQATRHALEELRMFREPPGVSVAAIEWFEQLVVDGGESWESKIQYLTAGQLYEGRPYPRTFEQMIPSAQQLILKGLESHPDPLVRLDCLRVYDRDVDRNASQIAAMITTQAKVATAQERARLERVATAVEEFRVARQRRRRS